MNKPVLAVFADGIGHDSIAHMPFLRELNATAVEPVLGYSVTCHASMYTGVYPEDHDLFFIWQRSPETSPFKGLDRLEGLPFLDSKYVKYAITRIQNKRYGHRGYFGIPRIEHLPYKYWPQMDVAEKKFWSDPDYLAPLQTLFDLARAKGLKTEVIGMDKTLCQESLFVDRQRIPDNKDWVYLFMGDIDYFTHRHSKESSLLTAQLRRIDDVVRKKYEEMTEKYADFDFVMWSDHGHVTVHERIDLYELFRSFGKDLNDYLHAIEATMARFWFDNPSDQDEVEAILSSLGAGHVLTTDLSEKYRVRMKDNRFGDLYYLLDGGKMFSKTIWGDTDWAVSMHGYAPDWQNYQATMITNFETDPPCRGQSPDLTHVFSTLADCLGLPIPSYVDSPSLKKSRIGALHIQAVPHQDASSKIAL